LGREPNQSVSSSVTPSPTVLQKIDFASFIYKNELIGQFLSVPTETLSHQHQKMKQSYFIIFLALSLFSAEKIHGE
jgi:hypothetical protein